MSCLQSMLSLSGAQVLDRGRLLEDNMLQQIKREIAILRDLHHPNVVDLKEVMGSRDKIYMVLECALLLLLALGVRCTRSRRQTHADRPCCVQVLPGW